MEVSCSNAALSAAEAAAKSWAADARLSSSAGFCCAEFAWWYPASQAVVVMVFCNWYSAVMRTLKLWYVFALGSSPIHLRYAEVYFPVCRISVLAARRTCAGVMATWPAAANFWQSSICLNKMAIG